MAATPPRPRINPVPPSRPVNLSRLHHQQGAEHHLARICKYSAGMKGDLAGGQMPSLEYALQLNADIARLIVHLSALKELDLTAPAAPVTAPVFRSAARTA